MSRITTGVIVFAIVVITSPARAQTLGSVERHALFNDVWSTIDKDYYNTALKGVDWQAVGKRYRAVADSAVGDTAFYRVLSRMVQELHDLHTQFTAPATAPPRTVGVSLSIRADTAMILRVDSTAALAGAQPGMIVLTVNGETIGDRLQRFRATMIPSSSERADVIRLRGSLLQADADFLRIEVQLPNGNRRTLVLQLHAAANSARFEARRLSDGIGYFRFASLRDPEADAFAAAFDSMAGLRGVVLDLRGMTGGDIHGAGASVASHLIGARIELGRFIDRDGRTPWFKTVTAKPARGAFTGPMTILVDGATRSAGEVLANAFQEAHRATVVGSVTCGCVLDTRTKNLPNGALLQYSYLAFRSPSGRSLESDGVTPDVVVVPTPSGLASGRDEVLDTALRIVASRS